MTLTLSQTTCKFFYFFFKLFTKFIGPGTSTYCGDGTPPSMYM